MLPGKRIRPLITLLAIEAFGHSAMQFIQPACAIELIHTYSLIHDDLPCMDDDDMRRGKPSLHLAFDEATALLAGDLLLTHSFELISTAPNLDDRKKNMLITALAQAAGGEGMIGGQMLDLLGSSHAYSNEYLIQLHTRKTGALLGYSFAAAGIISEYPHIEKLSRVGRTIGLAFQVIDDILDQTKTSEELGKPAGSDAKNQKLTILSNHTIEEAYAFADSLHNEAAAQLEDIFDDTSSLKPLFNFLLQRTQ